MSDIRAWLEGLGLGQYVEAFEAEQIEFEDLAKLDVADLKEMGLPIGPRRRVLEAIGASVAASKASTESDAQGAASDKLAHLDAERRQLTVLFCDMVGFTELASRVDPEVLQQIVRTYEDTCAAAIARYEGHVFQRLGDGIVAFFGYPLAHEGEAERAIRAGLEIIESLAKLDVPDAGHLAVRIGIAAGLVVVSSGDKGAVGLFDALWGLSLIYYVGRDVRKGREVAERCLSLANAAGDEVLQLVAHHAMGSTALPLGYLTEARDHFEQVLQLYGAGHRPELTHRYGVDPKANALQFLALTLWFLGYAEQALSRCRELSDFWPDMPSLYNRIWRSVSLLQVLAWLREPHGHETKIDADIALCEEQGFSFMHLVLCTLRGPRLAQGGRVEQGIGDIEQGIAVHRASGVGYGVPMFFAFLAEAHLSTRHAQEGLAAVDEGLAAAHRNGEHRIDAELHRLRGDLLLTLTPPHSAEAETAFREAVEIAHRQEAKSLELRAATSLASLWQSQGKRKEAYDLLAPIYDWFTEGFDTKDLKDAKALLSTLEAGG